MCSSVLCTETTLSLLLFLPGYIFNLIELVLTASGYRDLSSYVHTCQRKQFGMSTCYISTRGVLYEGKYNTNAPCRPTQ